LSKDTLFEVLGFPETESLVRLDGKPLDQGLPQQLIKVASWRNWFEENDEDIRIIDLGQAFRHGDEPIEIAQPGTLRAPETIFTNKFDYRIDLWRAGIMVGTFSLEFSTRNAHIHLGRFTPSCSKVFHFNTSDTMILWFGK
jgi:serine/threonine-protein kinase SRPK3